MQQLDCGLVTDPQLRRLAAQPVELHVWETAGGGEIDFVCGQRAAPVAVPAALARLLSP